MRKSIGSPDRTQKCSSPAKAAAARKSSRKASTFRVRVRRWSLAPVNCAGLPETLLESELFGHVKGSFTGAYRDKPGKLEMAHNGTVFLDEIGEMTLRMQGLLLRFLETGELQTVGADGGGTGRQCARHCRDQSESA